MAKLTDNEIIKALEEYLQKCQNIKYGARQKILVDADFLKDVLDLINRKNAEIERLQKANKSLEAENLIFRGGVDYFKAEAIKEFWSKLKTHTRKMKSSDFSGEFWDKAILVEDGDNLVKEMVGE